ncbi:MAG TPA: hypothetical protein VFE22_15915, partial [Edaphobacter sp.]|nr:hypothetical protein [Edaphobacter sp.]
RPVDRGLAASVSVLHNEIRVIGVLLERAAAFHANLLERMVAASTNPAPDASLSRPARLLVEA